MDLHAASALAVVFAAIVVLVTIANRINIAYPIVLVLRRPSRSVSSPTFHHHRTAPALVLVVFLPPLLYWESVTAPTSEFRANAFWIFQMAFGLVIPNDGLVALVRARNRSRHGLGHRLRARCHRLVDR